MQIRKIYKSGGSTYIISLPKAWVKKSGLKEGDSVFVTEMDGILTIEPQLRKKESKEITVELSKIESEELLERLIISYYLTGYDTIKFILKNSRIKYREVARRISELLVGVEIVEDTSDVLTLEILIDERKLPTLKAIRRINLMITSMLKELLDMFKNVDKDTAKGVIEREREVDRLYFLVVRQLKAAVRQYQLADKLEIFSPRDALGYRMVVKSLERISDHCENIARLYLELLEQGWRDFSDCLSIAERAFVAHEKASKAFFSLDISVAQEVFNEIEVIKQMHQKFLNGLFDKNLKIGDAVLLRGIIDSINRIAGYSSDIAEIAMNMSVDTP